MPKSVRERGKERAREEREETHRIAANVIRVRLRPASSRRPDMMHDDVYVLQGPVVVGLSSRDLAFSSLVMTTVTSRSMISLSSYRRSCCNYFHVVSQHLHDACDSPSGLTQARQNMDPE